MNSKAMIPESLYDAKDLLGEGPLWHVEEQALYWIDILNKRLQRFHPERKQYDQWSLPSEIGCFAFCDDSSNIIVALKTGFAFLNLENNTVEHTIDPEANLTTNRFNDGKCDRQGRFWAGTMGDGSRPSGALYRLEKENAYTKVLDNITVSNGLAWSPDNSIMYYTDSGKQTIYAYDFDADMGNLHNEKVFVKLEDGFPDGLTIDSEGCIWSAIWDGWRIDRFSPEGTLIEQVSLPVQRPTSCMFGGKNLDELFVTSASVDLSAEELIKQPLAGHVFKIKTQTTGLAASKFIV